MTPADELRIRAYLGDAEARAALALDGPGEIADLLQDGMLPLTPEFEPTAKRLLADLMRRARTNVELLWERLQRAGYLFYETGYYPPAKDAATQLDEFERATGRCVPLAYRAWVEIVGEVSFMGTHPGWPAITYNGLGGSGNAACSDPLVVQWSLRYLLDQWADWEEWRDDPEEAQYRKPPSIDFAPDPGHKSNYSSSGSYNLPATERPCLDALVTDDNFNGYRRTFLEHVRDSFAQSGFPGWKGQADAPLESLRELGAGLDPL